ncbi:putative phosphoglycerate mutase [Kushneria sinocarnis]|uniref:Putative phosphoglycerate mutase n=1 Tax=Kushneria sinocarnis TaxID=595502 RepID=A0A420WV67_9GAMM|nr:histidine phosphatase family protein [Kushneria sinocarnis]RKR02446.1 putative phosphoglycerate mutase [Kushneria sinocarnis]
MDGLPPRPFVFLRHGETFHNRVRLIAGCLDVPLTPRGEEQARAARPLLDRVTWSCVAVSPMFRARKTARLAVSTGPLYCYADLRERHWGCWENQPIREPMPYFEHPRSGESWEAFRDRVGGALTCVLNEFECPLVVAHSGVFRVIRALTQGSPLGPRVGNVEPILCRPPDEESARWRLEPLTAALLGELPCPRAVV